MTRTQYLESLASEGLRIASNDESGWTHGYYDDARGEKVATWITDAPAIATPAKVATSAAEVGVTESQSDDTVIMSLPGFDWDWTMDALLENANNAEYARTCKHIYNNVNPLSRKSQNVSLTINEVKTILEAFDAYLPWETPEVREDLRDLMETISKQIAPKVTA